MKRFNDLINECRNTIPEIFPWDLEEFIKQQNIILLDVREPNEFSAMHIENSLHIPRGILETACEWGYEETIPELVQAREKTVIIVCRSGNRSLLAARTLKEMGFTDVRSLKTGLRGWNDYELPLVDINNNIVNIDDADVFFETRVRPEQLRG